MDTAVVAASIAALAAIASAVISFRSGNETRAALDRQRTEDYRIRQLNELYGPMHMLRKESRNLWKQLPPDANAEPSTSDWHLIDHIEEIKEEPNERRRMVVGRILAINEEIRELIIGSGGLLVGFPAPEAFETFLTHCSTLLQHWNRGANVTDQASYIPFPSNMDSEIDSAIAVLRAKITS